MYNLHQVTLKRSRMNIYDITIFTLLHFFFYSSYASVASLGLGPPTHILYPGILSPQGRIAVGIINSEM